MLYSCVGIFQEARQRVGRHSVRTGSVLGRVTGGAAANLGLATRTNNDVRPAMTSSKPVFQVCAVGRGDILRLLASM